MFQVIVPGIRFYNPPIEYARITDAVRRGKQIARVYPHATVDIYRDGEPVFALGASTFGGCCGGVTPHRCWSRFLELNK